MKRLTAILLCVLLLAGCAGREEAPTDPPETETIPSPGLYDPDSEAEKQTGGAVRAYPLEKDGYTWLAAMGDGLFLGTGGDTVTLTVLTGQNGIPAADTVLPAGASGVQATERGAVYYVQAEKTVIFLDGALQEKSRILLPADAQGLPIVGADGKEVFYCTDTEVRGLQPNTGISRLIKQQQCRSQSLEAVHFHGKILSCRITDTQGQEKTVYMDVETGKTRYTASERLALETYGDRFCLTRLDGVVEQTIFGTLETPEGQLELTEAIPALALDGVVKWEEKDALHLAFYALSTGKKTASVEIPGVSGPSAFLADEKNDCLWFLARETASGRQTLYRWDIQKSPVSEDAVYTRALVTDQEPDEEGISLCRARAEALNVKYGIDIRVWKEAVEEPGTYALTAEYQTAAIDALLEGVETAVKRFPEGFLQTCTDGKLHICLVRQIGGHEAGAQYWLSGEPYIVLPSDCDGETAFLNQIGYVIDTYVLGHSVTYDSWAGLNPPGFTYDYDYVASQARPDGEYLEGDGRAFVDKRSMSFPTEDRSRVFACAMSPEGGDCFTSDIMQRKLACLCEGIRQAFDLEKDPDVFPWEQYLEASLTETRN